MALLLAVSVTSVVHDVPYVAAFTPVNTNAQPFSGTMSLNYDHRVVTGTYTDTSVQAGAPLRNRINLPVSGGVSAGGAMTLVIGPLTFHGRLRGQWITGTATIRGRLYTFKAREGRPGHPVP